MMLGLIVTAPVFFQGTLVQDPYKIEEFRSPLISVSADPLSAVASVPEPTPREKELLARIAALEEELNLQQQWAMSRQREWIEYIRVLKGFDVPMLPEAPDFISQAIVPEADPAEDALARQHAMRLQRGSQILTSLRGLLIADGVRTLDFLEVGLVHDHRGAAATGPVIARILDDRGRLMGMIRAEHLRIEVSHAARTVALVLEDGFEASGGQRYPFPGDAGPGGAAPVPNSAGGELESPGKSTEERAAEAAAPKNSGGVRRILFPAIDPGPWLELLSDLIDSSDLTSSFDDGSWDATIVRSRINRLLADSASAQGSSWKLVGLSGVSKNRLNDVQFLEHGPDGAVRRRVFADDARIFVPKGTEPVRIELTSGSVKRATRVAPFLGGRYRITLPFAKTEDWQDAEIPLVRR